MDVLIRGRRWRRPYESIIDRHREVPQAGPLRHVESLAIVAGTRTPATAMHIYDRGEVRPAHRIRDVGQDGAAVRPAVDHVILDGDRRLAPDRTRKDETQQRNGGLEHQDAPISDPMKDVAGL